MTAGDSPMEERPRGLRLPLLLPNRQHAADRASALPSSAVSARQSTMLVMSWQRASRQAKRKMCTPVAMAGAAQLPWAARGDMHCEKSLCACPALVLLYASACRGSALLARRDAPVLLAVPRVRCAAAAAESQCPASGGCCSDVRIRRGARAPAWLATCGRDAEAG